MVGKWLVEICTCSCLTFLPSSGWVLLIRIYQPFSHLCRIRNIWPIQNSFGQSYPPAIPSPSSKQQVAKLALQVAEQHWVEFVHGEVRPEISQPLSQ